MSRASQGQLRREVHSLLLKGAVEPVPAGAGPGFYSHIFTVPKKNSTARRLIINLRPLNEHLVVPKFRMETPALIREMTLPGMWATSIDLQDAYLHVLAHPSTRKFLRFYCGGRAFQFRALPFGLSTAPLLFTKLLDTVSCWAHRRGIHLHRYLDNWLILHPDRDTLCRHTQLLLDQTERLGFLVNRDKSALTPSQSFTYIGMAFDLAAGRVGVPQDRCQAVLLACAEFLRAPSQPLRRWQVLLGLLTSVQDLIPRGRLFNRPLPVSYTHLTLPTKA